MSDETPTPINDDVAKMRADIERLSAENERLRRPTVWRQLLGSRKVFLAVFSAVVYAAGKFGLELDTTELLPIIAPLWGALAGVALEDHGKAAAKVTASAA